MGARVSEDLISRFNPFCRYIYDKYNASSTIDAPYAVGGTVFIEAIKAAGTKDRTAVMAKMVIQVRSSLSLEIHTTVYHLYIAVYVSAHALLCSCAFA